MAKAVCAALQCMTQLLHERSLLQAARVFASRSSGNDACVLSTLIWRFVN
jgi:hypothetical protein